MGDSRAPTVSVVVPAYQNARFLRATLDSILAQSFQDFELLVSDHSSTDGSWELLESYDDPRLTISRLPTGGGAPANWNAVTRRASGRFVKLVCGDDLLAPDALALQVEALEAERGAVLVAARRDLVDAVSEPLLEGRGLGDLAGRVVPGPEALRALVRAGTNLLGEPVCVLMRRDALAAAGGWDGTYPYLIDQATYMRVLCRGDLVALDATLASFRVSDTQWSVALAASQARQAVAVHAEFRQRMPTTIAAGDVRLGNARARVMAMARRVAYRRWRRRMTTESVGA